MPVAKPVSTADWATDANFTNGGAGIAGTATKVAPAGAVQAEGDVPTMPYPAQRGNWWKNLVGKWIDWLDAIIDATGELFYPTPIARAFRCIPKILYPGNAWVPTALGGAQNSTHADIGYFDISDQLRTGQTLTGVSVDIAMGHLEAVQANRVRVQVYKRSGGGAFTQLGADAFAVSSVAQQPVSPAGINEVINRLLYTYVIQIKSSTTAGDGGLFDLTTYTDIAYTDLGPRNPQ